MELIKCFIKDTKIRRYHDTVPTMHPHDPTVLNRIAKQLDNGKKGQQEKNTKKQSWDNVILVKYLINTSTMRYCEISQEICNHDILWLWWNLLCDILDPSELSWDIAALVEYLTKYASLWYCCPSEIHRIQDIVIMIWYHIEYICNYIWDESIL